MQDSEQHFTVKHGSEKGFGLVFACVFFLYGASPLLHGEIVHGWSFAVGAFFLGAAFLAPKILEVPNTLWIKFGYLLGHVVSLIVLSLLYFAVFTPLGMLLRLCGKDVLELKRQSSLASYWKPRTEKPHPMNLQF